MRVTKFYEKKVFVFSIEIFPPKTVEGLVRLKKTLREYTRYSPDFISVTYGAGGSSRHNTHTLALFIQNELGIEAMAHLTCISHTHYEIEGVLQQLHASGIENLMALRGDPPLGEEHYTRPPQGYGYAVELINAVKSMNKFCIGAAGYPEGHAENPDRDADLRHQIAKVEAGAELLVSQFFLDNAYFLRWRDRLRLEGLKVPLIPGLLSPHSLEALESMASYCGVSIPKPLRNRLASHTEDSDTLREIGWEHTERQIEELIQEGAEGIHLYALNRLNTIKRLSFSLNKSCSKSRFSLTDAKNFSGITKKLHTIKSNM